MTLKAAGGGSGVSNFPPSGNPYSFQTYARPAAQAALTGDAAPATRPTLDWVNTISTNGNGTATGRQNWAGNGQELTVTMGDGTELIRHPTSTTTDELLISPVGGGGSASTWTVLATTTNCLGYSVLLRDPVQDIAIHITMVAPDAAAASTGYHWSLRCRAIQKVTGTWTIVTDTTIPYNGFLEGLSVNPYVRAGMGANGDFVLVQAAQYWPGTDMQKTQTLYGKKLILRGRYTGGAFQFDEMRSMLMEERCAYDVPFVGLNGDADYICGLHGRDVAQHEDYDFKDMLNGVGYWDGTNVTYNFDQIGFWFYNFRTRERGMFWITPRLGFQNQPAIVRCSWGATSNVVTIDEIVSGSIRAGMKFLDVQDSTTGLTTSNSPLGQFIDGRTGANGWTTGTPGAVGATNVPVTTSGGTTAMSTTGIVAGTKVKMRLVDPSPATPQRRYYQAIQGNDGFIWFVYTNTRQNGSATALNSPGTAVASQRIVKMSAMGEVIFDEPYLVENSGGMSLGFATLWENSNGQKFVCRVSRTTNYTEVCFMRVKENVSGSATASISGSTITLPAGSIGDWYPGSWVYVPGVGSVGQILRWGTYRPSALGGSGGTIVVSGTGTATSVNITCRGRVGVEFPCETNHINEQAGGAWGTTSAMTGYTGSASTGASSRSSFFLAWTCDDRSGSATRANRASVFISQGSGDHPSAATSATAEKLAHLYVRFPTS